MADEEDFSDVVLGSLASNNHSPRPPRPGFQGLLVHAPESVTLRPGAVIPICGLYLLPAVSMVPPDAPPGGIRVVATDVDTGHAFAAHLTPPDPTEPPDEAETPDAGAIRGGYFNPNLFDYLPIPWAPARYDVHAELAGKRSNVVRIRLTR